MSDYYISKENMNSIDDIIEEDDDDGENNEFYYQSDPSDLMDDDLDYNQDNATTDTITIGICAMAKKVNSKPMQEILSRLQNNQYFNVIIFEQDLIINTPIDKWPICDCLVSFYSKDFPLSKAQEYVKLYNPFLINDLDKQWDIMDRIIVYRTLQEAGIEQPRYAIKHDNNQDVVVEQDDQIEINGQVFTKPFVEKPVNADDHNVYIYFPSTAGGGSQRLFRKVGSRSSMYSPENRIRRNGAYIYEEFMPTDGTDVKVYTVGPEYAHAEARKSPALDGVVERDEHGKEIRYPIMLRTEEKITAKKIVLAFKQSVCGFDLLRAYGKSYVCDVNGFSFVKNSPKYYDDCAFVLTNLIMKEFAPQRQIPYAISYEAEDPPIVPTTFGTMMELRCVIAVMRHGDRTPKQKMKMEVKHPLFFKLFQKYDGMKSGQLKLKKPSQLQEVLDVARSLIEETILLSVETLPTLETKTKLLQLKSVLEMYGHFSGINRKVQFKYQEQEYGKPKSSGSEEDQRENDGSPSLLLILKWGGELTAHGRAQAEDLGKEFRKLYPGGDNAYNDSKSDTGFLRLHSTYRHDLKIYASDEGRVQMTAAAFTKGLLALDGELAPILVQMVKSANTNGLLDNDSMSATYQNEAKNRIKDYISMDRSLKQDDFETLAPTKDAALISALDYIQNPLDMCKRVYDYIKELTNLIRNKITESKYYEIKLYHSETWELMLRRWSKLEKDFYNKKKQKYEISKIPDIYDCIKYDIMYNQTILNFENAPKLYKCSKALADYVVPQEYGITKEEKLKIAQGIIGPLLHKINIDLKSNLTGIWNCEDESVNKLNPSYSKGIQSPGRHVRTRLYFTSESHVHSLINVIRYGNLFEETDPQWTKAKDYFSNVPELNYLTQVVIMMYEDTSVDANSDKRFHIELHFSPGAHLYSDEANTGTVTPNSQISNPASQDKLDIPPPSPTQLTVPRSSNLTRINSPIQPAKSPPILINKAKKSHPAFFNMKKHFKSLMNDVRPVPENSMSVDTSRQQITISSQTENESETKPRSFEDEHHRSRIDLLKIKPRVSESYNHYNTFHGSGTPSSYTPINKIFSPRLSLATNSSPDLNQQRVSTRRSTITYQELIRVREMQPLETIHNNLCFKTVNEFFSKMITTNKDDGDLSGSKQNLAKLVSRDSDNQL